MVCFCFVWTQASHTLGVLVCIEYVLAANTAASHIASVQSLFGVCWLYIARKGRGNCGVFQLRLVFCTPGVFFRMSSILGGQCDVLIEFEWVSLQGLMVTLETHWVWVAAWLTGLRLEVVEDKCDKSVSQQRLCTASVREPRNNSISCRLGTGCNLGHVKRGKCCPWQDPWKKHAKLVSALPLKEPPGCAW